MSYKTLSGFGDLSFSAEASASTSSGASAGASASTGSGAPAGVCDDHGGLHDYVDRGTDYPDYTCNDGWRCKAGSCLQASVGGRPPVPCPPLPLASVYYSRILGTMLAKSYDQECRADLLALVHGYLPWLQAACGQTAALEAEAKVKAQAIFQQGEARRAIATTWQGTQAALLAATWGGQCADDLCRLNVILIAKQKADQEALEGKTADSLSALRQQLNALYTPKFQEQIALSKARAAAAAAGPAHTSWISVLSKTPSTTFIPLLSKTPSTTFIPIHGSSSSQELAPPQSLPPGDSPGSSTPWGWILAGVAGVVVIGGAYYWSTRKAAG